MGEFYSRQFSQLEAKDRGTKDWRNLIQVAKHDNLRAARHGECSNHFAIQVSANHTALFKDDCADVRKWVGTITQRRKAHSSCWHTFIIDDFVIDRSVFKQLVDCEAVLLQMLGQLLANVINCLVGKATNDNAGIATNKMLGVVRQRRYMAGTLQARNDFLRYRGFASTGCANQAEALTLQGKLNGSKLLVVEAHASS